VEASGPTPRTVQVHPLDRCNLTCAHCYSSSSPAGTRTVDAARLLQFVEDSARMGYDHLSLSGGEPLLYPALIQLTNQARRVGMRVSVATNGTVATPARTAGLIESVDVFAVSLDGPAAVHDRFRGAGAFDRASQGIRHLVDAGATVAISHVLTRSSLPHLGWLVAYCLERGARLLHVHPLERAGSGTSLAPVEAPSPAELEEAYYTIHTLGALVHQALAIQFDVLRRPDLVAHPERVYAGVPEGQRPADRLGVLVVEPDGAVVPLTYGLDRSFAIGNLAAARLPEAFARWEPTGYPRLRNLCRNVWERLALDGPEFVNWYEEVALASREHPVPSGAPAGLPEAGDYPSVVPSAAVSVAGPLSR
jgi:MoaA/NifB/PqqE/SkfB family radical SAM enzyme